jgi:DNA-binding NarL/FixJ family response regulator
MGLRILIADDHPFVRKGLRSLLGEVPNYEVVDEAQDGLDAVEKAGVEKPDLVLLDISMPRMNGLEACKIIKDRLPGCEVLIVSQFDSDEVKNCAQNAGARGYVVKSQLRRDLLPAVDAVSHHQPFGRSA